MEMNTMKRRALIEKIIPIFIFFSLWLDGSLLPLILLPILFVLLVEKKSLGLLGFSSHGLKYSLLSGLLTAFVLIVVYYPIFLHYLPNILEGGAIDLYTVFLDIFHYPVYEEIAYRSFALTHFADLKKSPRSKKNLVVNIFQSVFFVSVHKHHFNVPLILVPVFLLGFLNGILFLKTRNVYGCIFSHSILNGSALLLRHAVTAGW